MEVPFDDAGAEAQPRRGTRARVNRVLAVAAASLGAVELLDGQGGALGVVHDVLLWVVRVELAGSLVVYMTALHRARRARRESVRLPE